MLQNNNLKKTPVRLTKTIVTGYQTLAGDFCVVTGEFSGR